MANLISYATGNLTGATTFKGVETGTGAVQATITSSTNTTTSYVHSSQFTGTNTIVVEGVLLHLKRISSTGTFSVQLSADAGTTATREVTVNCSDLEANPSWTFFKFGSTLTLDGGTDYVVSVKSSTTSTVTVYRDATAGNWAHLLRTNTAATAAAADVMYIVGEWTAAGTGSDFTVTMNQTAATDYGEMNIGDRGILTWGTSASTTYILQLSGNLNVWSGATYNMGTTGTQMPRTSTGTLQLDCAADGDYGLIVKDGGTAVLQGLSRTSAKLIDRCLLNTDEAINSTSLGVDTDTGWLDNDRIAVATTTQTTTQCEAGTLNGNAGASSLTVDGFAGAGGGLAAAHSGTSPTQAEVALLTRNVVVKSVSSTAMAYVYCEAAANFDADWVEFRYLGENASTKRGLEFATTTGTVTLDYCSICDVEDGGIYLSGTTLSGTLTFNDIVMYNCANVAGTSAITTTATSGTPVFDSVLIIRVASSSTACSFLDLGTTISNITVAGATAAGITFQEASATGTFSGLVVHGGQTGISASQAASVTLTSPKCWRLSSTGISNGTNSTLLNISSPEVFGCASNISASNAVVIDGGTLSSDSSFTTTNNVSLSNACQVVMRNVDMSTASGIKTAATRDVTVSLSNLICTVVMDNCKLGASTEVQLQTDLQEQFGLITSQKHDQTAGSAKYWKRYGTGQTDTTIYNTASPSERLTPNNASNKLQSGSRFVAVDSGATVTISVYTRKSQAGDGAAYNGNQPRLILKRNESLGITSDTVIDTHTAAVGSWEQLTGTTASAGDDGAFEFIVDCDGTTGWVNVDDWTAS